MRDIIIFLPGMKTVHARGKIDRVTKEIAYRVIYFFKFAKDSRDTLTEIMRYEK